MATLQANQAALLRITLVGSAGAGKTSLINAWVNRSIPMQYTETDDPAVYYKTVRLPGAEEGDPQFSALVEVEDSYASSRGDGVDKNGVKRDIGAVFLRMDRRQPPDEDQIKESAALGGGHLNLPFECYKLPAHNVHKPLTKNRMGFMFVFDATQTASYTEALNLHKLLIEDMTKKKLKHKPVLFLVANKIDKDPGPPGNLELERVIASARMYAQQNQIRCKEVSATDYKNVKKMFREMVMMIRSNQNLWILDDGSGKSVEEVASSGCVVQ